MKRILLCVALICFASATVLTAEEKKADAPKSCPSQGGGCCKGDTNAPAKGECPMKKQAEKAEKTDKK